jgi:hypothetical protein
VALDVVGELGSVYRAVDLFISYCHLLQGWTGGIHRTSSTFSGLAWLASLPDAMATPLMGRQSTSLPRLFLGHAAAP